MLRRKTIGNRTRLLERRCNDGDTIAIESSTSNRILAALRPGFRNYLLRELSARGHKDRKSLGIMLSLRYEVCSNLSRIAALAGHDNFRRTGQHINRAIKSDEPLGRGDVEISGTNNLVHARNRRRSVSERGNRVCSADAIEFRDTKQMCGRKRLRRRLRERPPRSAGTPATCAGIAVISSVEGSGWRPLGT